MAARRRAFRTTMPEQLIDTRFPGQHFPVGSVVTFIDRNRRTVFGTVTELRRHEAIVAAGETGRWRVRYAGLQLVKAGPTGGATMEQVEDHAAKLLERHLNTERHGDAVALPLRDRHEPRRHLPAQHSDHRALGQLRAASALGRHPGHAPARGRTRDRRARPRTRRRVADRRPAHRLHGEPPPHRHPQPEAVNRTVPPGYRNRWFRQRLTAKLRQRSICPRCRSHIAWRIPPTLKAADRGNARADLPGLLVRSDDRLDGHRHRQTTVRGPAPSPWAAGSFDPPAQPLLTT